jgi:hypothetical protein
MSPVFNWAHFVFTINKVLRPYKGLVPTVLSLQNLDQGHWVRRPQNLVLPHEPL